MEKHTSIVTPKDFYDDLEKEIVFEGYLYELVDQKDTMTRIKLCSLLKRYRGYTST